MAMIKLPRWGAFPFTHAGAKRGVSRDRTSSPVPSTPAPAQTINKVCGICGKKITEGEPTVQVRRATTQDPTPPLLPAHSVCFRRELLPPW